LVTKQVLEKKIKKYKEEIDQLAKAKEVDSIQLRMFRKRYKRTQRKLASLVRNKERVSVKGKSKGKSA